jgi:GMC oxidoreductase
MIVIAGVHGALPLAIAADTPEHGVVDGEHRMFGYQNLLVCDGAVIPANPGVNPSLTITAMPERAMAAIPVKPGAQTTTPRGVDQPETGSRVSVPAHNDVNARDRFRFGNRVRSGICRMPGRPRRC